MTEHHIMVTGFAGGFGVGVVTTIRRGLPRWTHARTLVPVAITLLALVTAVSAPAANLVRNPYLEAGIVQASWGEVSTDWLCWEAVDEEANQHPAFWYMPARTQGPKSGRNNYQRILAGKFNGPSEGGIVQAVSTTPGQLYGFEMDTTLALTMGMPSERKRPVARVGYDLTGQTSDPTADSIRWVDFCTGRFRGQFRATGSSVSIWRGLRYTSGDSVVFMNCDNILVQEENKPDVRIADGPIVSSVGACSVRIQWETDIPATSRVNYGFWQPNLDALGAGGSFAPPLCGYQRYVEDGTLVKKHSMVIDNLLPGTKYHFNVWSDGGPERHSIWSQDHRFRTTDLVLAESAEPSVILGRLRDTASDESNPRDLRAHALLAVALTRSCLGDHDGAVRALDQCMESYPEFTAIARCRKCQLLAAAGKTEDAVKEQERISSTDGAWSLIALGWIRVALGQHQQADKCFTEAIKAAENYDMYELAVSGSYRAQSAMGNLRAAERTRQAVTRLSPCLARSGMLTLPWEHEWGSPWSP